MLHNCAGCHREFGVRYLEAPPIYSEFVRVVSDSDTGPFRHSSVAIEILVRLFDFFLKL